MPYYDLKMLKCGFPPNVLVPQMRPASGSEDGSELIEAGDDDEAAKIGTQRQAALGDEYIITVSDIRDGERVMVYPRPEQDG